MRNVQRALSVQRDLPAIEALVHDFPAGNLHVADLPYRLSSWALDDPQNVRLWFNADGRLLAWAIMQTPFWSIDYACRPDSEGKLHRQVLAWADRRARQTVDSPSARPTWFVNVFDDQVHRIADLELAGFAPQTNVGDDSWSKVLMRRRLQPSLVEHPLPAGFIIRSLGGEAEIGSYVGLHRTVFDSRNMTAGWRARTLHHPSYVPDLDLVAVAPDGSLAAFCVCWLDRHGDEPYGQIEPVGVHPDFRRQGLGKALLSEALRRLGLHGARQVCVETDNDRDAALALYESLGFREFRNIVVCRKDYATP